MYLTVILIDPPTDFDVATILRFLYVYAGPSFKLVVLDKKLSFGRVARYARIPLSLLKALIDVPKEVRLCRRNVMVMDRDGVDVTDLRIDCENLVIAIPFSGNPPSMEGSVTKVKPPVLCGLRRYEAVSLLYALMKYVCGVRLEPYCECSNWGLCSAEAVRDLMYLARKVAESKVTMDSCVFFEPHAVAAVIGKVVNRLGFAAELSWSRAEVGFGACRQLIAISLLNAYSNRFVGSVIIEVNGYSVRIECRGLSSDEVPICGSCMCVDALSGVATVCGETVDLTARSVDYGLVRLVGIHGDESGETLSL